MEQTFEACLNHLVCIIRYIVPSMNNEFDGMDDDDLGKVSSGFVEDKILFVKSQ